MNNLIKNVAVWLVIALVLMTVFNQFSTRQAAQSIIPYSQFMEEVKQGRVKSALVEGRTVRWQSVEDRKYVTFSPGTLGDLWMVSDLLKYGVKVDAKPEEEPSYLMNIFISWFPMLLLIGIWIFFMRQMQGGGRGGAFSFGKSSARKHADSTNTVT
ncbi:MAG: ATP-dependent metallopeptidase FtsH/Yme1/Tma family protein, partial [Betaproteobacteria bacterium]|nr:ATP-dependent metallopeptidase FtsH/Yme1/Tma family protein [Betaproteobacteria bacterium]